RAAQGRQHAGDRVGDADLRGKADFVVLVEREQLRKLHAPAARMFAERCGRRRGPRRASRGQRTERPLDAFSSAHSWHLQFLLKARSYQGAGRSVTLPEVKES